MTFVSYLLPQLPYLAIQVAVFAIGIVLSMSYMRRANKPATFALGGSALLLVTTVGTTLIAAYLVTARPVTFGMWLTFNTAVGSVLRAAGYGLLLAAAFVERGSESRSGSLSDRIGKVCASCGARGPAAASFCMYCGAAHS